MPIHYWVDLKFNKQQQGDIDTALKTISTSVGCISFHKDQTQATGSSFSQIQYIKDDNNGCGGTSYIGHQTGGNPTHLSADPSWCFGPTQLISVILHETVHDLGGDHEMCRTDRDRYVTIKWKNIEKCDPTGDYKAQFAIDKGSTSYGVPFDYSSIMNYGNTSTDAASGASLVVMVSKEKNAPAYGGNVLTKNDVLQLKRMYCVHNIPGCTDSHPWCGNMVLAHKTNCDPNKGKVDCPVSCGNCDKHFPK